MNSENDKLIIEALQKAPEEIRQILLDPDFANKVENVAADNRLSPSQTESLYTELSLALLGITPFENFAINLENNVNIDGNQATIIKDQVVRQILRGKIPASKTEESHDLIAMNEKLRIIGNTYGLHLDQISILESEIRKVMDGTIPREPFSKRISNLLGIDGKMADAITSAVNQEIFIAIREAMQTPKTSPMPESSDSQPSKDAILAEIENPTPTVHPISAADQTQSGPAASREVISERAPATPIDTSSDMDIAKDFIGGKLTDTVSLPSQKTAAPLPKAPEKSEKPKSYATDPYREPLI